MQARDRPAWMRAGVGPVRDDERLADDHARSVRLYSRRDFCSRVGVPRAPLDHPRCSCRADPDRGVRRLAALDRGRRASADETPAEQARIEQEFADAEAYQEQWRKEEHKEHPPESLY